MDFTKILVVIFTCVSVSYAKTTATLTNPTPKEGEDVVFMCVTEPIGNYPSFGHKKKFKESDSKAIELTDRDIPNENLPIVGEGRYSIVVKQVERPTKSEHFNLTMKNVKFADSGFLGCTYNSRSANIDEQDFTKLLVQVDGESVKFAEYQDQTDLDYEDFSGKDLKLTCVAKGTIPGNHTLMMGNEDITGRAKATVVNTAFQQIGKTGRSKATWTSTLVYKQPFTESMLTKSISCRYQTPGFDKVRTTTVHLQSKVAKPHLMCANTEIDEVKYGDPANFTCTVNIKPELTNVTYSWNDGLYRQHIVKGGSYKDRIFSVYEPNANGTMAKLTLVFKRVMYHHKNMKVTLYVSNTGGHATQDFLIRKIGYVSGSTHVVPSILTILLAAVAFVWRQL